MEKPRKIRLSEKEIEAIVETAKEVFGENVRVWLFGSRADTVMKIGGSPSGGLP